MKLQIIIMQKFGDGTKKCSTCKEIKLENCFDKDKSKSDGLMTQCKICKRKYRTSEYYHKRELELERTEQYRERRRKYKTTPKGKHCWSNKSHYDRSGISNIYDLITFEQWQLILTKQEYRCAICNQPFSAILKYTKDCIIPISKGGNLTFDNTQALCFHCNAVKHSDAYAGLGNRWRRTYNKLLVI